MDHRDQATEVIQTLSKLRLCTQKRVSWKMVVLRPRPKQRPAKSGNEQALKHPLLLHLQIFVTTKVLSVSTSFKCPSESKRLVQTHGLRAPKLRQKTSFSSPANEPLQPAPFVLVTWWEVCKMLRNVPNWVGPILVCLQNCPFGSRQVDLTVNKPCLNSSIARHWHKSEKGPPRNPSFPSWGSAF